MRAVVLLKPWVTLGIRGARKGDIRGSVRISRDHDLALFFIVHLEFSYRLAFNNATICTC